MRKTELEKVKGEFSFHYNGEFVVLSGAVLYIFRPDGSLVAKRSDLKNTVRTLFLSGNRMLIQRGKVLHLVNLENGEDLWQVPYPVKAISPGVYITASAEERYAFLADETENGLVLSRLDLETRQLEIRGVYGDCGGTDDIRSLGEDTVCLLKALVITVAGKPVVESGVRLHDWYYDLEFTCTDWKSKWSWAGTDTVRCFFGSADQVLTQSLHVFTPETGEMIDLLENETTWKRPKMAPSWVEPDNSGRYLKVYYFRQGCVFIDLQERKVCAAYATDNFGGGCLIAGEYWDCEDGHVVRKPFPLFEEFLQPKMDRSWFAFGEHKELW